MASPSYTRRMARFARLLDHESTSKREWKARTMPTPATILDIRREAVAIAARELIEGGTGLAWHVCLTRLQDAEKNSASEYDRWLARTVLDHVARTPYPSSREAARSVGSPDAWRG